LNPAKTLTALLLASASLCSLAIAGQVASQAELALILGDSLEMEDFEGVNLAGGTSLGAPNPLSSLNAPASWGIVPGVTYQSGNGLGFFGAFVQGNDSVVLGGSPSLGATNINMTISFAAPQLAVGLMVVNITGNLAYHDTVTFYNNATVLGSLNITLPGAGGPSGARFVGWQDLAGITSVRLGSDVITIVDDVTWGVNVSAVPELPVSALWALGLLGLMASNKHRSLYHAKR
jgi:hypothetical protein